MWYNNTDTLSDLCIYSLIYQAYHTLNDHNRPEGRGIKPQEIKRAIFESWLRVLTPPPPELPSLWKQFHGRRYFLMTTYRVYCTHYRRKKQGKSQKNAKKLILLLSTDY